MEGNFDHDPNSSKSLTKGHGFTVQGVNSGQEKTQVEEAGVQFRQGETTKTARVRKVKENPLWEPKSAPAVIRTKVTSNSGKITPR